MRTMVRFLVGAPANEVYREAIEQEVGHELPSIARECKVQPLVQLLLCPTSCGCSQKKTSHRVQYGILRSTICNSLAHAHAHAHMCLSLLLAATTFARRDHSLAAITFARRDTSHSPRSLSLAAQSSEKLSCFLSVPIAQLVKA